MKLTYAQLSSAGPVRKNNEDWVGFWEPSDEEEYRAARRRGGLGRRSGWARRRRNGQPIGRGSGATTVLGNQARHRPRQALAKMFTSANIAVYDRGMQLRMPSRMATTLTLSIFRNNEVHVGHVGDCRAYLIQGGRIQQMTTDHNYAASQVKMGLLSPQEAADQRHAHCSHPQRRAKN